MTKRRRFLSNEVNYECDDEYDYDDEDENVKIHRYYDHGIDDTDLSTSPVSPTSSLFSRTPSYIHDVKHTYIQSDNRLFLHNRNIHT